MVALRSTTLLLHLRCASQHLLTTPAHVLQYQVDEDLV